MSMKPAHRFRRRPLSPDNLLLFITQNQEMCSLPQKSSSGRLSLRRGVRWKSRKPQRPQRKQSKNETPHHCFCDRRTAADVFMRECAPAERACPTSDKHHNTGNNCQKPPDHNHGRNPERPIVLVRESPNQNEKRPVENQAAFFRADMCLNSLPVCRQTERVSGSLFLVLFLLGRKRGLCGGFVRRIA